MLRIFPFKTDGVLDEVEKLEKHYSISLPEKYKEFLLKYNGGDTIDATFRIDKVSSDIRAFYGFENADYEYNFQYLIDHDFLSDYIEVDYLPIAEDSFRNYILLGIAEQNYNQVAFFDHEKQRIIPFHVSFKEFLGSIKSKVCKIKSIDERIQKMKEVNSPVIVDDELKAIWQEEIDKYAGREQVIVKL
ncbi:SMI1/KNR4 family protein [Streptococcus gordonii]|uniref:SMI1/KNR4 family protein n=1 Tax=Streptococcus gordonii TaxID=1302 RepID=UPI000779898F|nr:SMI1/KNR4 family protein [Streptococcus gordonii]VTT24539.1 putative glucan synthasis protein [Streptococcus gordonii]